MEDVVQNGFFCSRISTKLYLNIDDKKETGGYLRCALFLPGKVSVEVLCDLQNHLNCEAEGVVYAKQIGN